MDFADAIKLVEARGKYMQEAVPAGAGAMYAIIGLDDAAIADSLCKPLLLQAMWLRQLTLTLQAKWLLRGKRPPQSKLLMHVKKRALSARTSTCGKRSFTL